MFLASYFSVLIQHDIHGHNYRSTELGEYAGSVYFIYSYTIDLGMKKLKLKLHILLKIIGLIFVGSVSNTHKSNYWQES